MMDALTPRSLETVPVGPFHHTQVFCPAAIPVSLRVLCALSKPRCLWPAHTLVSGAHTGEAEFLLSCKYRRSREENLLFYVRSRAAHPDGV